MGKLIIRKALVNDLAQINVIEHSVQPVPWSVEGLSNEFFSRSVRFWVLCPSDSISKVIGYICFRIVTDEVYLSNIAIMKQYQGLGYGTFLLKKALYFWTQNRFKRVTLDVYKKNYQAISFYRHNGFLFACAPDESKGKFCVMEMKLSQE